MTVSERRDSIRKELGEIRREIFEAVERGNLQEEVVEDFRAETKAVKTEWMVVREMCGNLFHSLSDKERKNNVCPDCGIRQFEWVMENDL